MQLMSEAHVARHWIAHHCLASCLMHLALHLMTPVLCLVCLVDQRQHLEAYHGWVRYAVHWQASVSIGGVPRG